MPSHLNTHNLTPEGLTLPTMSDMIITERIKQLKDNGTSKEVIEYMLLDGELGSIAHHFNRYIVIGNYFLSHLVVEAHHSGFLEYTSKHPRTLVVHHRDGNISNNSYLNLKVMKSNHHASMHVTAYFSNPNNKEAIDRMKKKISDTKRKQLKWVCPEDDPEFFNKWFTSMDYATLSGTSRDSARWRLDAFHSEGKLLRRFDVVNGYRRYVYVNQSLTQPNNRMRCFQQVSESL